MSEYTESRSNDPEAPAQQPREQDCTSIAPGIKSDSQPTLIHADDSDDPAYVLDQSGAKADDEDERPLPAKAGLAGAHSTWELDVHVSICQPSTSKNKCSNRASQRIRV